MRDSGWCPDARNPNPDAWSDGVGHRAEINVITRYIHPLAFILSWSILHPHRGCASIAHSASCGTPIPISLQAPGGRQGVRAHSLHPYTSSVTPHFPVQEPCPITQHGEPLSRPVPAGPLTIARHFSAGNRSHRDLQSPSGTTDPLPPLPALSPRSFMRRGMGEGDRGGEGNHHHRTPNNQHQTSVPDQKHFLAKQTQFHAHDLT
jgi:hypothetical protein